MTAKKTAKKTVAKKAPAKKSEPKKVKDEKPVDLYEEAEKVQHKALKLLEQAEGLFLPIVEAKGRTPVRVKSALAGIRTAIRAVDRL